MGDAILNGAVMGAIFGAIAGGLAALLLAVLRPQKRCPECGTPMPKFRMPQSARQWLWGGWTCSECGCEVDRKGQRVGPPRRRRTRAE